MKVAILGWGSLIWDPRELQLGAGAWRPDGPLLPIEFLRVSDKNGPAPRLTLVLYQAPWVAKIRTLWHVSALDDFERACVDLAKRERTSPDNIGFVKRDIKAGVRGKAQEPLVDRSRLNAIADAATSLELRGQIDEWLSRQQLDAVIWTDLAYSPGLASDAAGNTRPPTVTDAIQFLNQLRASNRAGAAEEYIRRAPPQVRTSVRERVETDLDWLPRSIASPIGSADDLRLKEWEECRTTIGRLDGHLEDLRKVGFSLIVALLTASSFLASIGIQTSQGASGTVPIEVRTAALLAIMVLIAALFSVDNYYEVLLSGAVERALDLESQTDPPIRTTKYLSINATSTKAVLVTVGLYVVLLLTASLLGSLMLLDAAQVAAKASASAAKALITAATPEAIAAARTATEAAAAQIAAVEPAAFWFVVGSGLALAYVVIYRVYCNGLTQMGRQKPDRTWPEGPGKVAAPPL